MAIHILTYNDGIRHFGFEGELAQYVAMHSSQSCQMQDHCLHPRTTSYPPKEDRDVALRSRLAHVTLAGRPIGALTQDEPLPGGYLSTSLTAHLL